VNLAQVMISMEAAGCTAEQLAAVAADHQRLALERRVRRACERAVESALAVDISATADTASPVSSVTNPDSGGGMTGAATAAGGTTKAVGRAALLMMPGLRPAARRIGARLIEHHNLNSGRCDPSVAGMARQEGLSERSVRRALAQLEAAGLIGRHVHGSGRRNAYRIDWAALQRGAAAAENGAAPGPIADRTRTLVSGNPDGRVRQNLRRNKPLDGEGGTSGDRRQRELPLMRALPGGKPLGAAPAASSGDPIEAAIRGKYRGDHGMISGLLGGWWALSDEQRAGFAALADFEAWLRQHGPPEHRGTG